MGRIEFRVSRSSQPLFTVLYCFFFSWTLFIVPLDNTGIYITFEGHGECEWIEKAGDKRIIYQGKENLFSSRFYFMGEENGKWIFATS